MYSRLAIAALGAAILAGCEPALAENGVIHHHPGIDGEADLDADVHGWENPVAKIIVERIN